MKLMIDQFDENGLLKTWQLDGSKERVTIGSSPYVDLYIGSDEIPAFLGVFEFDGTRWLFVDLRHDTAGKDKSPALSIGEGMTVEHGGFRFSLKTYVPQVDLFHLGAQGEGVAGEQIQVFIVSREGVRLEVATRQQGQFLTSRYLPAGTQVPVQASTSWIETVVDGYSVRQKTFSMNSTDFAEIKKQKYKLEHEDKKSLHAFLMGLGGLVLLIGGAIATKPDAVQAMIAPEFQKIRDVSMPQPKPAEKKQAATSGGAARVESPKANSAFNPSRITQLIGKISSARARSKNILVGKGVEAGTAPSGRALAALQKFDGSQLAAGEGMGSLKVSTSGLAGGNSVDGMGRATGGRAGTLGVGVLDEESEVAGGLDRDVIAQHIRAQIGQILYCYERQLSATPDLFGKVAVRFTINADGRVESQKIGESTLKNSNVEGCVLNKIAGWKFPLPDGGTKVLVTYPFFFKSTN